MVTLQALALTLSLTASGQTVLLDFYSEQCPPCRQMMPVIAQFENAGYPVRKINTTQQPQLAGQYNVRSLPCFVMVADGREVGRLVGYQPPNQILALYQRAGVTPEQYAQKGADRRSDGTGDGGRASAVENHISRSRDRTGRGSPAQPQRLTVRQQAMAASVRIKIKDGRGHSYGSGTIVDTQDGEALVLTCGHIFRDSQGRGDITVDLFDKDGNPTGSVAGQVIRYDLERDVGLIAIRPNREIEPMQVAGNGKRMQRGERVFSIGCDRGDPPTVRESRVTHINKYLGPANIEVAGAPVDGRSGGGLFSSDGQLIGVCNAADPEDDEGLYAALETVHKELIAANLEFIFENDRPLTNTPAVASKSAPASNSSAASPSSAVVPRGMATPASMRDEPRRPAQPASLAADDDTEVIVIVRSRSQPQQQNEVLFIREPSRGLMDVIADHRRHHDGPQPTSMQVAAPATGAPVFRGQD